jgi:23S rRNA (uracil1939-C5)-methyltransferase
MQTSVAIQYVGRDGQGVGTDDTGNLYFVPGAVPGDRVLVDFPTEASRYRDATLLKVLSPSEDRRESPCEYFQHCGGCDWLNWDYTAQLVAKEQSLIHVLNRSELKPRNLSPIAAAPNPLGYRTRVQLRREGGSVGFLKRRSNELVSIERCVVAHPKLNEELVRLKNGDLGPWRKVELSVEPNGEVSRFFDSPHGALGFSQVNAEQNTILQKTVFDKVVSANSRRVLELYCGDGNLTHSYISKVERVLGVDLNAPAMEKAVDRTRGLGLFEPLIAPVDRKLVDRLPREMRENYDTIILDPPRSGVGKTLQTFIHPGLKTILYVSCSSITFSQDVKGLAELGFMFQDLVPIDMFPQTRHLELVGTFIR